MKNKILFTGLQNKKVNNIINLADKLYKITIIKSNLECRSPLIEGILKGKNNQEICSFKASYGFGKWNILFVDNILTRSSKIGLFVKLYCIYKGNNSRENIIKRVVNMDL